VAQTDGTERVRIGVLLARRPEHLGEWLADGAALEAAGADALWIDLAPETELDPVTVTAALAALTYRSLLVLAPPVSGTSSDRALATAATLSRGRLRVLSGSYDRPYRLDSAQRWVPAPVPDSRATWRAVVLDATERGYHGLVVPADPRLVDILRNPDDPGQRLDLHLASG
jgi:hypothetical protein